MEKAASRRLPSDGLSFPDTGMECYPALPGAPPVTSLALPAPPRTPQTVDAATPLPAWRPDFSDGAPFVGPFVRAVRAAYVAHAWIRKNAALFPVTLLGSPSSSLQLGLPAGSQVLGKESTAAHWAAALWKSTFHKKSTKLKGPATTQSTKLKGPATTQSAELKGPATTQPTGAQAKQHLTTEYY